MINRRCFYSLFILGCLACTFQGRAEERKWIEARSPHFSVFSDSSEKRARQTAHRLEQFRKVMQIIFPKYKLESGKPLIVLAAHNGKSMQRLLYGEEDPPNRMTPVGYFANASDRDYILIQTDVHVDQAYPIIYKGYVSRILRLNIKNLPRWLAIGLSEFYGEAKYSDKNAFTGLPQEVFLHFLRNRPMLPWEVIFSDTDGSAYAGDRTRHEMFYAQCWGLVHYMQMEKKKNSGKLNTYLQKVRSGVSSTDAARQVFGDFETLGLEINRYANLSLKRMRIPIELETRVDEYPVRDLTESESLAYRGGFLMVNRQMDQSETMLKKALQLDPTNPAAHEGMGMLLLRRGDQEKAGQHFATAAELGGASYLSYFYAANAAIKRDSNIDKAEEYLQKAVAINPEDAASRDFLKNILEHKESRLKAERAKEEWENRVRNSKPDSLSADLSEADGPSMDGTTTDKLAESNLVLDELSDDQLMEWQELKRKIDESERPVRTGPKAKIEGTIGSVRCEYPAIMDITLESGGKQQTLRARNYYEVKYWVPEHAGEEEFDPCRDLKDCQVEIDYITAFDEDFIGLIQTIKIKE